MKNLALLLGSFAAILNAPLRDSSQNHREWHNFKLDFGKSYENEGVEAMRKAIFDENKLKIQEFNDRKAKHVGYTLGLNKMADVSSLEFKTVYNRLIVPKPHVLKNSVKAEAFLASILNDDSTELPDEVDWRKTGRVSSVKDQGDCGSCWAFSAVGALEGQEKSRGFVNGSLIDLSVQNILDCDHVDSGCEGGWMDTAIDTVSSEHGIDDEKSYPYKAYKDKCKFNKNKSVMTALASARLPEGDERTLKEVVAKFGPVAVAIDASNQEFQYYESGVHYSETCHSTKEDLNHGVLVVGYGTDPKLGDYWIVKNSWGLSYGDKGYIKMARNRSNNCGIATVPVIPVF